MSKFMIDEGIGQDPKEYLKYLVELNKDNPLAIKELVEFAAEVCAKEDISNNKDDVVILVDTRFERKCIRISIRS